MNNLKLIFIFLLFFFLSLSHANAAREYKYVCDNDLCYNTFQYKIDDNYYLKDPVLKTIDNFNSTIANKLQDYINYYSSPDKTIIINDFCEWDCLSDDDLYDKEFSFSELVNYWSWFHIWEWHIIWDPTIVESFDNGKDFLFTYFEEIINEFHDSNYPVWDKENKLTDLVWNIVSYSNTTNQFHLRNVCSDRFCRDDTSELDIYLDYSNKYRFITWEIRQSLHFVEDTFKVSEDYKIAESYEVDTTATLIKAWDFVVFDFWFEDYLDFTEDETSYRYRIYYNDSQEWIPDLNNPFIEETIVIDNTTIHDETMDVSSEWIWDQVDEIIHIDVLDEDSMHISVRINEWISIPKVWNKNFYLQADNLTSWESFPLTLINVPSLEVLHNDNITTWIWNIVSPFDTDLNSSSKWFWVDKPFKVEFNLYDSSTLENWYWNEHFDNIDWYDISISAWSSEYIELSSEENSDIANRSNTLTWMQTNFDNKVVFYFRITQPWYHNLNWFNFTIKSKVDSLNYVVPYEYHSLNNVVPSNLYDGPTKMNIFIKSPTYDQLPLACWQEVNIKFVCDSDNLSWCYDTYYLYIDESVIEYTSDWIIYNSESDNNKQLELKVRDLAYNWLSFSWTLNHIDKTAPIWIISKWDTELLNDSYSYIVNDDNLNINFFEWTTDVCVAETNYEFKINDVFYSSWTLDWINTWVSIPDFFKKSWNYNFSFILKDKYWNTSSWDIDFMLYADSIDWANINTTIKLDEWETKDTQFANNSDIYNYILTIKDSYDNPVKNKHIVDIDFKCPIWLSGCIDLMTDMWDSWFDAIIEPNSFWSTDDNWQIRFSIKSLAPWYFSEYVNVKMYKWDDENNDDTSIVYTYSVWKNWDENSFNKPLEWNLYVSDWSDPKIWLDQKYNLELKRIEDNNLVIDSSSIWKLYISDNTIINNVDWHYWNSFNVISNIFNWNNISTDLSFSWVVDADYWVLDWIDLITENLKIQYKLWWKIIRYYLDNFWLSSWCVSDTLWLKVIWSIQWDWKSDITWQESNFSDLTKSDLRFQIRKNAFLLTRNRESGIKNLNNVIYIKWDKSYSELKPYLNLNDTVIIKDWNFIIDENIDENIWIIVLKSNYVTESDYNNMWNIYINNSVTEINAIIYSDWALRSADSNWNSYIDSELGDKLLLNGSIFTRNTIWWAIRWNSSFTLPWWQKTTHFDLAQIYDLNYIRKVTWTCWTSDDYSFLIKYNPSVQLNPPKWFETK